MTTRTKKIILLAVVLVAVTVLFTGCLPHTIPADKPANFLNGLIHGWLAPISLIMGIFTDTRVYEANNIGWWYDFAFYIAVISEFGTLHLTRSRHRHH